MRTSTRLTGAPSSWSAAQPEARSVPFCEIVVLPSLYFGRRVRKLSRASQDRVADSSAIAAEVLNAIPVV